MSKTIILSANTDWYLYNFRKNMIRALVRNGFTVLVVSPEGEFVENLIELGCDHLPWKVGRRSISPVSEFLSIHQLKKIYKNVSPDLIHHHTLKSVIYGSIAARQAQIPFINSIPGRGFVYSSTSLQSRIIKPAVDLLLRQSVGSSPPHTIFENRGDMQYFLEKGFVTPNKAHLIRSVGVDTAAYTPKPPPIFDQFTVGYVGRMLWDKGAGIFAEAAKIIQTQNPTIRMVMVGTSDPGNPDSISDQQLNRWHDEGIIDWWGWQADMPGVYAKLHTLAFPTRYAEGVPTVLLEAGASKRALIASDTPPCQEVIEDGRTGFLVPPNDPQSLADRILCLAGNQTLYNQLRENAYTRIISQFSVESVNRKTFDIYQKVLNTYIDL